MNAKQIFVAGCSFFLGAGVVSAASYQPFAPQGGLAITTLLPGVYSDGSDGTLEQTARMADSSVQQADIGAASGVAPLDSNKMMPAAVSGDSSSSPAIAAGTASARSLSDRFSDAKNIKDFGIKLDGTDTAASLSAALGSTSNQSVINVPKGTWINGLTAFANPRYFNVSAPLSNVPNYILGGNKRGEGIVLPDFGDANTVFRLDPGGDPIWQRIDRSKNGYYPLGTFWYINANPANVQHYGVALKSASEAGSAGNMNGTDLQMYSEGNNSASAFDVNLSITTRAYGTNYTWGLVNQHSEVGGLDVSGGGFSHSTNENDYTAAGPELPASQAWPGAGDRSIYYTNGWISCGQCAWTASTTIPTRHLMHVTATDGTDSLFVATTGGVTGTTQPTWDKTAASIADGTVVWSYLSPYKLEISKVLYLEQGASVHYGALVASNADFYDAAIDLSKSTYSGANPSVLRMPAGVGIDMDADGTLAGQNRRVLRYDGTLSYRVNGAIVFAVSDTGGLTTSAESHMSDSGFADPDPGSARTLKIAGHGLAVSGGIKTDTLTASGLTGTGNAYACLNASGQLYRSATACN